MQGKRAGSTAKIVAANSTTVVVPNAAPAVTTISVSQQSFDGLIDNFTKLIQIVSTEAAYLPNETELKVATLNTLLASLKAANTSVINTITTYSNARIARNTVLYEAGSDEKKIADGFDKNEFDFSKNMGTYCNHSAKKRSCNQIHANDSCS
jgi:maltooligosyltrehalose synthase